MVQTLYLGSGLFLKMGVYFLCNVGNSVLGNPLKLYKQINLLNYSA